MHNEYAGGLRWVLRHQALMLCVVLGTMALNVYLFMIVPKGFFPQQDTGRIGGRTMAAQDISFPAMAEKQRQLAQMVLDDPLSPRSPPLWAATAPAAARPTWAICSSR